MESLCIQFGECKENFRGESYWTFPTPSVLGGLRDEALDSCNLGYRSKYILKTAGMVEEGAIDLYAIQNLKYEEAKDELMKCYGVGVKVAECVCLFALHHKMCIRDSLYTGRHYRGHHLHGRGYGRGGNRHL